MDVAAPPEEAIDMAARGIRARLPDAVLEDIREELEESPTLYSIDVFDFARISAK